jgi:spore coat polysaccharide biosynthesis protein SpsF (cytidylyltransferase family)
MVILQARSASTRLPGKAFLPFNGTTILGHMVNQICSSTYATDYAVAAPINDAAMREYLEISRVRRFYGSELDVLDRFYHCAKSHRISHVVRLTADCPLVTGVLIDRMVHVHLRSHADYTANRMASPYPDGFDVEVMKYTWLEKAHKNATSPYDREHVTPWIKDHAASKHSVLCPKELAEFRHAKLSVDTRDDYERVVEWWNKYGKAGSWAKLAERRRMTRGRW